MDYATLERMKDDTLREYQEGKPDAFIGRNVERHVQLDVTFGGPSVYVDIITDDAGHIESGKYIWHEQGEGSMEVELTLDELALFEEEV